MIGYYKKFQKQSRLLRSRVNEGVVFLRRFVGAPRQVGSVMPSSPYLTRAMMDKIEWSQVQGIAELGAGTGVFTRAIVKKLKQGGHLLVFEIDPTLKAMIEAEHPGIAVYGDARELPQIMRNRNIRQLDCVVSSLPFAVLPPRMTAAILDAIDKTLKPGGKLVAYQYSKHMRPYFEKRFARVKISFVLRNVPPAFVYECTKA
ncbi:MAG: methyltransferase domain-containing protein [Synergistaceae bacterium]|nr:methyltransferase domain-containing protein [Synergistaceae bacterium]